MSMLLSARRQASRAGSAFEASLGLSVRDEGRIWRLILGWVVGLPLCLLMGAAANYGWHWLHNEPVEQRVEIKKATPLPYALLPKQYEFDTQPFPELMQPDPMVIQPTVTAQSPAQTTPTSPAATAQARQLEKLNLDGVSPALAKRFMQALATEGQAPDASAPEITPQKQSAVPDAEPLATLPASISSKVPPLRYSSHVFSSTPANRVITINGRDYHEGSEILPGLTLLSIQAESSIFRIDGQSFSLPALTDWNGLGH